MKLPVALGLFLAAGFLQTAAIKCSSICAACWKDGAPGVDIKFSCDNDSASCGNACPAGYSNIHCAKSERCSCIDGQDCSLLGPCACGSVDANGVASCKQGFNC